MILITNNPQINRYQRRNRTSRVIMMDGSPQDVLVEARRRIHQKWRFLADPGAGRDKHRTNPYLTVWLTGPKEQLHLDSLSWLEQQMLKEMKTEQTEYDQTWLNDFQRLDAELARVIGQNLLEGSETVD